MDTVINNIFPAVDPIPLPAPVWLFKALHVVTLALHFISVEMLLGGLLVAIGLNYLGSRQRGLNSAQVQLNMAGSLARRLPVVMTYVINLGVPPLLFAQVLYGRALYTSSVLIGLYWISVIFLLMGCYWLLYQFSQRVQDGRLAWPFGLSAWLLAGLIARIYSTNMTLMLRPEAWNAMYSVSAAGTHLPPHDPTLLPRWGFIMAGSLVIASLWMIWLAGCKHLSDEVRAQFSRYGGRLALAMVPVQAWIAMQVYGAQSEVVRSGLANVSLYHLAGVVWLGAAGSIVLLGVWCGFRKTVSGGTGWLALTGGLTAMLSMTLYRDGVRDLTLASKGFDVWERQVVTNWSIVGLFLVLFVAGLLGLAWLLSVVARAKPVSEKVTI